MRGGPSRIESDVTSSSERENAPFVSPPKASGFSRAFKGAKRALGFSVPEQNPFRENTPRIAPADTKNVANLLASGPYSRSVIRQAVANIGGIDEVILGEIFEDESSNDNMLPIYYESTDSDGDVIEEFLFNVNLSDYTVE